MNVFPRPARADSLRLLLHGFYHPGRAMPVAWEISPRAGGGANSEASFIELKAADAISARVDCGGNPSGVFPWWVLAAQTRDIHWRMPDGGGSDLGFELHPLGATSRLIGVFVDDRPLAGQIFPHEPFVTVRLEDGAGVSGPAAAWQSLDGLLLTPAAFGAMDESKKRELFAMGIVLAVVSDQAPDARFGWKQSGRLWIASSGLAMPSAVNGDVYAPAYGESPGRSGEYRAHVVLVSIVFGLCVIGAGLWRSRWAVMAIVALCAAAIPLLMADNARYSPMAAFGGDIVIPLENGLGGRNARMVDAWTFFSSHRAVDFAIPLSPIFQPMFADVSQPALLNATINCDATGQAAWMSGKLPADFPLGVLARRMEDGGAANGPGASAAPGPLLPGGISSPLRMLVVRSIYPDYIVAKQLPSEKAASESEGEWPTLVLGK